MKNTIRLRNFLALAGNSLLAMSSANAVTLIWDADTGTSGAQDGGGNWTVGGTTFWDGAINVATANSPSTDIAQFGNAGTLASQATVNVSTQNINGLIFGATTTSGYNLTASSAGQILTLGNSGITVNAGAQATSVGSANLGITINGTQTWKNGSASLLSVNGNINTPWTISIGDSTNHGSVSIGGVISGAGGITMTSRARLVLGDANEFTGAITVNGFTDHATLAFTSIADFGSTTANSLGKAASGSISLGNGSSEGRLEYIGSTNSESNRTIEIKGTSTNGGQIFNNGTGTITFDAAAFNTANGTSAHSFLLSGTNTGNNIISGTISNGVTSGASVLSLNKTGAGTWILSGNNTYGGTTTASGTGKLVLSGANTPGASATTISDGGELVLDYSGVGKDNAKIGTGALSLNGGTVTLKGGSHAQTVASTSLGGAGTFITRTSGTSSLNLGAFTTITRGSSLSISADNVATTDRTNTNGILGGNFVVGNNWAVNSTDAAGGAIVGLSTYTALPQSGFSGTTNYSLTGSQNLTGTGTVNSLKIIASADGQTLDINTRNLLATNIGNSAGYLFTANDDSYTYNITGTAFLRTATANQDTFFFVNNGTLNLTAGTGSGTGQVIKVGSGTLILGGNNGSGGPNWSGGASVQQGTLRLTHNTGAGNTGGGITVQNLAALELGNSVTIGAEALNITGTGISNGGALRNHSGSNTYGGAITIGVDGARINSNVSTSLELTAGITTASGRNVTFGGAGNTTVSTTAITGAGGLIKDGAGTTTLSAGVTHSYTGATTVSDGKLIVNGNISTSTLTTVASGATLGGSGTVGKTTVLFGGTLSPGNSPGTMTYIDTLALAGNVLMEIDGTDGAGVTNGHDFINLTGTGAAGALTYGGTMTLDMGVIFGTGSYTWNLFDMVSETGTFTGITLADKYSGSLLDADLNGVWDLTSGSNTWQFTESTGVLGLTVVPEPRAALLGGIGMLMLLRRRRV